MVSIVGTDALRAPFSEGLNAHIGDADTPLQLAMLEAAKKQLSMLERITVSGMEEAAVQRNQARLRADGELEEKFVGAAIMGPMAVLEQRRQAVGQSWPVGLFLPTPPGESDAIWKANKV